MWNNLLYAIATNKQVGNAMSGKLGPAPGDETAFDRGTKLRPIGSNQTEPSAWFVSSPMTGFGLSVVNEFLGDGPYPLCESIGMTSQQVAVGKAHMILWGGPRAELEGKWQEFLAANGYEVIP